MRNIKITIEYDGTNFVGWQYQTNGRSVQEVIEKAVASLLQEEVRITGGGRTDAGVHAKGQVANFFIKSRMEVGEILRGINSLLPFEVVVHSMEEVSPDFHARYSAIERSYRYVILRTRSALERHFGWQILYPLNIDDMQRCALSIVGEHDFRSFCKSEANVEHYRCIVRESYWRESDNRLYYYVSANRFLRGMVRALVGTMVDVGRAYTMEDDFQRILEAKDRRLAGMAAPAKGLFLENIIYDGREIVA